MKTSLQIGVLFSLLLVLSQTFRVQAQWSDDPAVNTPICTAYYHQLSPMVIQDGRGSWIVAWNDERYDVDRDIFAQKVTRYGYKKWAEEGIPVITFDRWQQLHGLVSDGSGGAILVWTDTRADTCIWDRCEMDIYAQRIDSTGQQMWNPEAVPICTAPGFQTNPVITTDGEGGAIIAWMDGRIEVGDTRIFVQRVDREGNVLWEENGVLVQSAELYQEFPEVVADGEGGVFIIWRENYVLYAKRFDSDGSSQWGEEGIRVSYAPGLQKFAKLISDGNGCVIIVWRNKEVKYEIMAQRLSPSGERLWGDEGVLVSEYADNQTFFDIVPDGFGGVIVGWDDRRDGETGGYVQKLNIEGQLLWQEGGVYIGWRRPGMIKEGNGGLIILKREPSGNTYYGYAQRLNEEGNYLWEDWILYNTREGYAGGGDGSCDGSGGFIITWYEFWVGYDIYGQYVDGQGKLGGIGCPKGDVNDDSEVDILDVVRAINIILERGDPPTGYEICAADLNLDGVVNILDIMEMVNLILDPPKKITSE